MQAFESLFAPSIFILNLVAIFDVVTGPKDMLGKILWVLAIFLLPVLGLVLYYTIGKENLFARLSPR